MTTAEQVLPALSGSRFNIWAHAGYWKTLLILVLLLAPVVYILAAVPILYINQSQHDIFVPLDAGWRFLAGQWPHRDYASPVGIFYPMGQALAMKLFGIHARTVSYANLLVAPLVLMFGVLACLRRLPLLYSVPLIFIVTLAMITPGAYDYYAMRIDEPCVYYLCSYNHQCVVLLCFMFVALFFEPLTPARTRDTVIEGICMGLILLFMAYTKLTFAIVGAGAVAASVLVQDGRLGFSRRQFTGAALAAVVLLLGIGAMEAYFGVGRAYLADLSFASAVTDTDRLCRSFLATLMANTFNLVLMMMWLLFLRRSFGVPLEHALLRKHTIVFWLFFGAVLVLAFGNNDHYTPLSFVGALYGLELLRRRRAERPADERLRDRAQSAFVVLSLCLLAIAVYVIRVDLLSVNTARVDALNPAISRVSDDPASPVFDLAFEALPAGASQNLLQTYEEGKLKPIREKGKLTIDPLDASAGPEFAYALREGINLVRELAPKGAHVANLDFSNPFPYVLGWPSPKGLALWWDVNHTFSLTLYRDPAKVFADTDLVLIPMAGVELARVQMLQGVYEPYLKANFDMVRETKLWRVYRRPGVTPRP